MDQPSAGVRERLVEFARRHHLLRGLLIAYLTISTFEFARILLYDRPRSYEASFYSDETARLPGGNRVFRWTRGHSGTLLRPLYGQIVRIPLLLSRPDMTAEGIGVEISIDGHGDDGVTVYGGGWQTFDYYLPALFGNDPWNDDPTAMALEDFAVLEPADAEEPFLRPRSILRRPSDYVQVFTKWQQQPGPPSVWFRFQTDSTFIPAELASEGVSDQRELGVAVGELSWLAELPAEGIGLHAWEEDINGRFVWTKTRASLRVARENSSRLLRVTLRPPPDPSPEPLIVGFYWNADFIETQVFQPGQGWTEIDLPLPAPAEGESSGILTVKPSRTSSPRRAGVSADGRELGIAIRRPRWVQQPEGVEK